MGGSLSGIRPAETTTTSATAASPSALPNTCADLGDPLGDVPEGGRAVLALLRRRIGGATAECIAAESGLGLPTTERHLAALRGLEFVRCEERRVLWGYGTVVARLWELSLSERCVGALAHLEWQQPTPVPAPQVVPPQFWSLFQSGTHPADLRLPRDAVAVAGRMLDSADLAARAWALSNLPIGALRELRSLRGYDGGPNATSLDIAITCRPDA